MGEISLHPDGAQGDEIPATESQPLQILRGPEVVQRTGLSSTTIFGDWNETGNSRAVAESRGIWSVGEAMKSKEVWIRERPEVGILIDPDE